MRRILTIVLLIVLMFGFAHAVELPKPTYDNSIMFSWTHNFRDTAEIEYIKSQFGNGIYAPLMFSGFYYITMDWKVNPADSNSNISTFKATVDELVSFAKANHVGIHMTLSYGLARYVYHYDNAKIEDIRNAQWYNDNNISSLAQQGRLSDSAAEGENTSGQGSLKDKDTDGESDSIYSTSAPSTVVNKYVFTTLSRYARKVRAHLDAKVAAAFTYLKQVQSANPDITIIVSAPGEPELNFFRLADQPIQEFFCDYSPFTVLEFRDWIQHTGLYADGEKYASDRYSGGGSKYQGAAGLTKFNSDFGTSFTSWNLKYYHWNLSDPVDTNYADAINPDTNIIPVSSYNFGGMMPASGSKYVNGGFDPPRVMQSKGVNSYYDLWHTFREKSVYFYVKDMTDVARASGFPKAQYYTHQIPADYLFGTKPTDVNLNPRYYSSASPLWSGFNYSDNGTGVTIYDIKFPDWFARTSLYSISASNALSNNWAALEYHPEVIPLGTASEISDVPTIYAQMLRLYEGHPHVISFFKWVDTVGTTTEYRYKGNNREIAAKQFFDAIKDQARQPLSTVFSPKNVEEFVATYNNGLVSLTWSPKIWTDLSHLWTSWGKFKEFGIYRGYSATFVANANSRIAATTSSSYVDYGFAYGTTVYYKIIAFNQNGQAGPEQTVSVVTPEGVPTPILNVSRTRMNFGHIVGGSNPPAQVFRVSNAGGGALNWSTAADVPWLTCTAPSGVNSANISVAVDASALVTGEYTGVLTVSATPPAIESPKTITIYLSVKNSAQGQVPFGSFDSPISGATVQSSVPVTGWVLDDTGVASVKLYREPVAGEGSGLIIIGDALFVDGARPDVEAAYPQYPGNSLAGWGYMLLTNFLPNGGNGTFVLHVKATDTSGNEVTLGTKTIIVDNASAIKPFGALDTPTQGGNASGSAFLNWGWALTPQPNKIPTNGTTIDVWIDGLKIGHPTYNLFRSDIATLFPSYSNSAGAIGYFSLDTTAYSEGVHSIQWTAMDDAGNSDGIGSRYFTVIRSLTDTAARKSSRQVRQVLPVVVPNTSPASIRVQRGFPKGTVIFEETFKANKKGEILVEIPELARLVITPGCAQTGVRWTALQMVGSQYRELPIGSTFDPRTGTLYWQPGQGFIGEYSFRFDAYKTTAGRQKVVTLRVKVNILPKFGRGFQPVKNKKNK